jgi:hypothetical protein
MHMKLFGSGKPDHPMADRKEATRLLGELPPQDLKAVEELANWYESVGAAEGFKAEERAQRLAMLDEAAQPRLRKLSKDYLASVRSAKGSRAQENLLWTRLHNYWRNVAHAYAGLADSKAPPTVVISALRAAGQQLKWQQLRYGPVDPAVWGLMNRIYLVAETRGIAEAKTEYLKAAMFTAASPDTRPAAELELLERIVAELAGAFTIASAPSADLPYAVDLAQAAAPTRASRAKPGAGARYLGAGAALGTLQKFIEQMLARRQIPAELKPQPDDDAETVLGILRHLATYWAPSAPERRHKRVSVKSTLKVTHGFDGVVEALGANPDDSLSFHAGAVMGEQWTVDNISAGGFGALVPQAKSEWVKVGALVAAQPEGASWQVGMVRRVARVSKDEVRVGVETLSRSPCVSRFALPNLQEAQGVLLPSPAPASADAAIALRAGVYTRGENLQAVINGKPHIYMPQGQGERGEDYEIVRFKAMVKES